MRWETLVGLFWGGRRILGKWVYLYSRKCHQTRKALGIFAITRGLHIGQAGGANVPLERPHAVEAPQMRVLQAAPSKAQVRCFCAEMQPL